MGNVPSRRWATEVPVASFSVPLASSLAVRSVRRPPRRSCSGIEILPSINLATHNRRTRRRSSDDRLRLAFDHVRSLVQAIPVNVLTPTSQTPG